jgi:chromosome partitioning protein
VIDEKKQQFAFIPKRSAIAEAQAVGAFIAEMSKSAARDAWREIKPSFDIIVHRMGLVI